jgi:ribosomal protein L40E
MTTFEDVLYRAKTVAESAGKKTSDFVEITKLKMDAAETEKDIASTLEGLGRLVYDGKKAGEDVSAMVDECIVKVDELNVQLQAIRDKIFEYKNSIRCKTCGAINPDDAIYCKKCGAKLKED